MAFSVRLQPLADLLDEIPFNQHIPAHGQCVIFPVEDIDVGEEYLRVGALLCKGC
jgi:hypothetical protein